MHNTLQYATEGRPRTRCVSARAGRRGRAAARSAAAGRARSWEAGVEREVVGGRARHALLRAVALGHARQALLPAERVRFVYDQLAVCARVDRVDAVFQLFV